MMRTMVLVGCVVTLLASASIVAARGKAVESNECKKEGAGDAGVVGGETWVGRSGDEAEACDASDTTSVCKQSPQAKAASGGDGEHLRVEEAEEEEEEEKAEGREQEAMSAESSKREGKHKQGNVDNEEQVGEAVKKLKRRKAATDKLPSAAILLLGVIGILVFNVYKVSSRLRKRRHEQKQKHTVKQLGVNKEREKAMKVMKENERKVEQMTKLLASMQSKFGRELRDRKRTVETLTEFSAALKENSARETTFT